jgi:hypothetical protein
MWLLWGNVGVCAGSVERQSAAADKRSEATFNDASATLHEVAHLQGHLAAEDILLTRMAEKLGMDPVPVIDTPPAPPADEDAVD